MGTITIEGDPTMTRLCAAAEAMNCEVRYDATLGCILKVRSQEPMYHNLTDAELIMAASRIDSLYVVKALVERLESARECRRELESAEERIAELEAQLSECDAHVSELENER